MVATLYPRLRSAEYDGMVVGVLSQTKDSSGTLVALEITKGTDAR